MKAWFKAEDEVEAKRYAKSLDMAIFIWQLCANSNFDEPIEWDRIRELKDEYDINPDELIE